MHRLLITWLAQSAGNDRALAQYEVYRRTLAVNQGAAPSLEMRALAERLRDGGRAGAAHGFAGPDMVPATSFFGRTDELAALHARLAGPDCRLLTLHGLGGVGKTRLAQAAARKRRERVNSSTTACSWSRSMVWRRPHCSRRRWRVPAGCSPPVLPRRLTC